MKAKGLSLNIMFCQVTEAAMIISEDITGILEDFSDVFQEPKGLPPSRRHDHAIVLKEGAEIPNIRTLQVPTLPKE